MKAFYGLAILYLLSAVLWSLIIFPNWEETYQGFNDGTFALEGFGSVVAFVGFSLLAFEFTVGFEDAEIVHVGEPVSEDD